jgi:glycosyltransferase involved in cell wall biosynthesis
MSISPLPKNSAMVSIIVPFFNEEENLPLFFNALKIELEKIAYNWEVLLIDNCSVDLSSNYARDLAKSDKRIKYVRFSRNFGPSVEASINAGYRLCIGDAAIVIYSDLQDPPEMIGEFIEKWNQGFDVVYGLQTARLGEPYWRRFSVRIFYRLLEWSSDTNPIPAHAGDFRLISRKVIDVLNQLPERSRYTRGLIAWVGFKSIGITYKRNPRMNGKSSAHFFSILTTALTAITSFSLKPLRILTGVGICVTFFAMFMSMFYAVAFLFGNPVPGLTTVTLIGLLTLGLNMGALGLIGEYVGRINLEAKQRPLYIIDEQIN